MALKVKEPIVCHSETYIDSSNLHIGPHGSVLFLCHKKRENMLTMYRRSNVYTVEYTHNAA